METEVVCDKHKVRKIHPECPRCQGDGEIEDYESFESGAMENCWQCNGTGIAPWLLCDDCEMEARDDD